MSILSKIIKEILEENTEWFDSVQEDLIPESRHNKIINEIIEKVNYHNSVLVSFVEILNNESIKKLRDSIKD